MTMAEPQPAPRRNLRGRVVRVVILSPRPDRVALIAGALSSQGHITLTATSLTDASDRRLWDGAHVVLLDWAPYEHDSPESALLWVTRALPRIPVVPIVDPFIPRQGIKAMALHAAGLLFSDRLTTAVLDEVVRDAHSKALTPPPEPRASRAPITRECMAIVGRMAERYRGEGS